MGPFRPGHNPRTDAVIGSYCVTRGHSSLDHIILTQPFYRKSASRHPDPGNLKDLDVATPDDKGYKFLITKYYFSND